LPSTPLASATRPPGRTVRVRSWSIALPAAASPPHRPALTGDRAGPRPCRTGP